MATPSTSPSGIFQLKYNAYCDDLKEVLPELATKISIAQALGSEERISKWKDEGMMTIVANNEKPDKYLPGVEVHLDLWNSLSSGSQHAIREHINLLSFCVITADGVEGAADTFFNSLKDVFNTPVPAQGGAGNATHSTPDLSAFFQKLTGLFVGEAAGGDKSTPLPSFQLPPHLANGQLAKLIEEMMTGFKPEDLGITPEMAAECDKDPGKAFQIITEAYKKNPEGIKNIIKRIMSQLQAKIQSGSLRPAEIKSEIEEVLKSFTGNMDFRDMLGSFKDIFGAADDDDPDFARSTGRDGQSRAKTERNRLREVLRKRKEEAAKKAANK